MAVAPRRVAAHIIRKPVVESAVCEVIENAGETSRVDLRELRHMLADSSVDLETDIEVCAEPAEPASIARSTRLAHTVRRAGTAPVVPEPTVTVQVAVACEPEPAPPRDRTTIYAAAAAVVAAAALLLVVMM